MWDKGWRDEAWRALDSPWDLIVIGGGITGAGILREAARAGLSVLLVEGRDFASGASSRSSKLVHGGFRYLKNGQVKLTFESVRERERLLKEGRGLVTPLGFLLATFNGDPIPAWVFGAGLVAYDLLAFKWGHRHYDPSGLCELCPLISTQDLRGGYRYFDAETDDARLVLRIIQEAVKDGGLALNYARVTDLLLSRSGQVRGVALQDQAPGSQGRACEVLTPVVVNAAGAWSDELRSRVGAPPRLRRLRGSHLVFPAQRLPLARAVSVLHPADGRPVFAIPWEGVTILGTTDVDHETYLQADPSISSAEAQYLLDAARFTFPALDLSFQDVQSTFSGFRPVIHTGKADPSKESREHILWCENGLLTIAGGKLTTFRLMAHAAFKAVCARLPGLTRQTIRAGLHARMLDAPPAEIEFPESLSKTARLRLLGRLGTQVGAALATFRLDELEPIPGAPALWAELRWAARAEAVVHLDDLLLRRVRLGLLLPEGGLPWMERIRSIVQTELGWDDSRWDLERSEYVHLWQKSYHFDA